MKRTGLLLLAGALALWVLALPSASSAAKCTPPYCPSHTLTVKKAGSGSGTVISVPAGINCGSTCSAQFESGKKVALTAIPASDSTFAGWSGGGCSGAGSCIVTIGASTTVTATFDSEPPPTEGKLTVASTALVKRGRAALAVACSEGPCKGTLLLVAQVKKGRRKPNVIVGIAPFELAAGKSETLSVKLSGRAKRELRKHGRLKATATGAGVVASTVLLIQAKKKH